ncbi:Uma2 family endonuclease [Streptomyces sp. HNM0574]|uniref:Uma2 family endonuclease n=1 Tax=Streptomyces sp. HNM0574 TaxID=2714954 RepID=UPI00146AA4B6|nr:Uma2 family endonuclease [Streptomyces sp. HNM0574]NLU68085.1 Uma2 family endonuclease [Streptomyces sp. HNM0574]
MTVPEPGDPDYVWPRPPQGGYTADDLDRLPNLPPHTQLLDASLVFASRQTNFHSRVTSALGLSLVHQAGPAVEVIHQMTVTLGRRDRPEPDLMLVRAEADEGPAQTSYAPEDVLLAVEVVSPDSVARDRDAKPRKYAAAGIPHFWRVENDNGRPVVYVFELEPATRTYAPTGIFRDRLKVTVPCPLDIDLTEAQLPNG